MHDLLIHLLDAILLGRPINEPEDNQIVEDRIADDGP